MIQILYTISSFDLFVGYTKITYFSILQNQFGLIEKLSFLTGGDYSFVITVKPNFFEVYRTNEGECAIKEGWTYKLRKAISDNINLPCSIAFRRAKYRAEEIRVSGGYCRQTKCSLQVTCFLPHSSNQLTIEFENYNMDIIHDTRHQERIEPERKKEITRKLQGRSAYAVRSELADEIITNENDNAGRVPSLNALRLVKFKSQTNADEQNAVLSLNDLRLKHLNCIQRIDLYPFATQYSTPAQVSWYKNEFKGKKRSTVSVDATGVGLISPTNLKTYILLYAICAHGKYAPSGYSHRISLLIFIFIRFILQAHYERYQSLSYCRKATTQIL